MATGNLTSDLSIFHHKRKRTYNDDELTTEHDLFSTKRRNLTQLPIRSPQRPSIAVSTPVGSFGILPGTLTPDSIPEDEEFEPPRRPADVSNESTITTSSVDVVANDSVSAQTSSSSNQDTEMEISTPRHSQHNIPTPLRVGRARSNDLMLPIYSSATLNPMSPTGRGFARDRIPTPVASSFPARSPFETCFASANARKLRPQFMPNSLSPMVDAESWTPQIQRPPSPDPDIDEDSAMMGVEDSNVMSSSFSSLSVHTTGLPDQMEQPRTSPTRPWSSRTPTSFRARGLGLDGASNMRPDDLRMSTINDYERPTAQHSRNQSSGRTARLHMGFRADCEKCVARVPGHYSHIFWS